MFMTMKRTGNGPGLDPDQIPKSVINRVGTSLRAGEVLMLDFDNQSYDTTATITGCLGNGITPASTSPTGALYALQLFPMVLVTKIANSASGQPVDCIVSGWGDSIQTNSTAVAGTIATIGTMVNATLTMDAKNTSALGSVRVCMLNRTLHTVGTGEESIFGYFTGNDGK